MDELTRKHQQLLAQARIRVAICSFMGLYYLFFGVTNNPVYLIFAGYSLLVLLLLRNTTPAKFISPYVTLAIDNGFTICGLHVTGERGAFLLFFLIHISFAYGVRFGQRYLIASLLTACLGVAWLYQYSLPWQGRIHFLLSFLFGMPFISFYVFSLTSQLRESECRAKESSARTSALLAFLTHDIRAPIQYVLESASFLSNESLSPKAQMYVGTIKKLARLMANMAGRELRNAGADFDPMRDASPLDNKDGKSAVPLYSWIHSFTEAYRAVILDRHSNLKYEFDGSLVCFVSPEIPALERIFANIFSNAIRYCDGGYVLVKVTRIQESPQRIQIQIQNHGDPSVKLHSTYASMGTMDTNLASGAGLGLKAVREAAQSIGATFTFSEVGDRQFSSSIDIELPSSESQFLLTTTAPVIGVFPKYDVYASYLNQIAEIANVYRVKNIRSFAAAFNAEPDKCELLLLIDAGNDSNYLDEDVLQQFDWPRIMLRNSALRETIQIDGNTIAIGKSATLGSWRNALLVAEMLLENGGRRHSTGRSAFSPLQGKRILILDDNVINLSILSSKLAKKGIVQVTVATIDEAEKEMQSSQFEVVITDWNIGATTAETFLSSKLSSRRYAQTRFLVLSADIVQLEKVGLNVPAKIACLVKPVTDQELFDALNMLLGHREEGVGGLSAFSPSNIFNSSLFFEYEDDKDGRHLVRSLLSEFLLTVAQALEAWDRQPLGSTENSLQVSLHKLASMCYAAGAYALGDEFKKSQDSIALGTADDKKRLSRYQLSTFRAIFDVTSAHIRCFLFSISC